MSTTEIPAGTWVIDPSHSTVGFSVRHLMVSKVRGTFETFSGTLTIAEDPLASSVTAEIDLSSVNTSDENRDGHLKSGDFFDVESNPTMTFTSISVTDKGDDFVVMGDLTVKGITKPVELALVFNGTGPDPWGGTRAGFEASTEISRKEFGVDIEMPLDSGGVVVGDKITIELDVEATLQTA